MDPTIWSALPNDVLFENILPFCDIDTRLALKIKPRRLSLARFETGDFFKAMQLRYAPNPFDGIKGVNYVMIPMHTIAGWDPESANDDIKFANVNLIIHYDFNGYRKNAKDRASIQILVHRLDKQTLDCDGYPESHCVANFWIRP
jgi:hypothetical protein